MHKQQGIRMAIKTQVDALLSKKMDRENFIKHVAIGMVALSGVGAALRLLAPQQKQSRPSSADSSYGGSAYGGIKR